VKCEGGRYVNVIGIEALFVLATLAHSRELFVATYTANCAETCDIEVTRSTSETCFGSTEEVNN
jgi:hypothetical protein